MGEVGERLDLRPIEVEGIAHFTERLERGASIFGAFGVAEPREADGPRRPDIMPAIGQAGSQRDAVPLAARIGTEVIAVGLARRAARIDVGLHMAIAAGHAQTHRLACPIEAHQDAAGRTVEPRRIAIAAEMPPRTDRLAPGTAAAVLSRAAQAVPYRLPHEPAATGRAHL